jgi:hypothetical protein
MQRQVPELDITERNMLRHPPFSRRPDLLKSVTRATGSTGKYPDGRPRYRDGVEDSSQAKRAVRWISVTGSYTGVGLPSASPNTHVTPLSFANR